MNKNSKKQEFICKIEHMILSGRLKAGDKLPTERELTEQFSTSRTVVNAALAELALKGFIQVVPRKYTMVADYKRLGTIATLESIMNFNDEKMDYELLDNVLDARALIEIESVRLASLNADKNDICALKRICQNQQQTTDIDELKELDFKFHHCIAVAGKNAVYPLIYKSFKPMAQRCLDLFYTNLKNLDTIRNYHKDILAAIENHNASLAQSIMSEMLEQGKSAIL